MRHRLLEGLVCAALLSLFLFCLGFVAPVQFIFLMMVGWGMFLARVLPQLELDLGAIILSGGALLLFVAGLHWLLRWFVTSASQSKGDEGAEWKLRSTISIAGLTLLMFVAGISFVGITHQCVWLATSKEPLMASTATAFFRLESGSKLKQLALGMQNYEDTFLTLPPGATVDREGRLQHSWMTLLLPFGDQRPMFDLIHFNRPWDDPVQGDVFQRRLKLFESPYPQFKGTKDAQGRPHTHYAANVYVIGGTGRRSVQSISAADGTTNTLLAGEAAGNFKAWGQPGNWRDPALGINQIKSGFGSPSETGASFSFVDGSVRFIASSVTPEVLRALATPAGGETIPDDY